jgi:peptidyl-prolyl cis-trans isomerase D
MATLEKIRNKAGVLVAVVIGISLLAFILTDLFSSKTSLFKNNQNDLAKIGGKTISYQEYEQQVNELSEIYKKNSNQTNLDEKTLDGVREQIWQQYVQQYVYIDNLKNEGVGVSSEELFDLVQGKNPHPLIRQSFSNPQTGEFNRANVLQFLKSMEKDPTSGRKASWLYLEAQITSAQTLSKYLALVSKGLYVTKLQAKDDFNESVKKANIKFFFQPYSSIPDATVKPTESELKSYYKKHKKEYEQNESREIEYVSFDVLPSTDDVKGASDWINKIKPDFIATTDNKLFVTSNSDGPYLDTKYKSGDLPDSLNKFMFDAKIGEVFGPYTEGSSFKLAKLDTIKELPDSVKARHILIKVMANTEEGVKQAKAKADSLKKQIENGADFAILAKTNSVDGSAEKGGDLGWFKDGSMVKEFNDFCFEGKKGQIGVVQTQFGYHVIEIVDMGKPVKKVRLAIVERKIEPSELTSKTIYQKANVFAGNNVTKLSFDKNAGNPKLGLVKKTATLTQSEKNISGFESSRELFRWAYAAKEGDVSGVISADNKYVVAVLAVIREKGIAPFDQVRGQVEVETIRDLKAQQMIRLFNSKKGGAATIEQYAAALKLPVMVSTDVSFASPFIQNAGMEPSVVAAATTLKPNSISNPIRGINGVFVVNVTSVNQASGLVDYRSSLNRLSSMFQSKVNYGALEYLKKDADIKDFRFIKFY